MSTGASCAIGVDVGGTKIEAIVLDAGGHERWRERVASPRGDYDASLQAIAGIVNRARQPAGGVLCTIGIGAPFELTDHYESDVARIREWYRSVSNGKNHDA